MNKITSIHSTIKNTSGIIEMGKYKIKPFIPFIHED